MKRLLDINTWIALSIETHPQHRRARSWYEQTPLRPGDLLFCRQTELGFLRLITQVAVMARCGVRPLSNTEAIEFLDSLYADPAVSREDEHPALAAFGCSSPKDSSRPPRFGWMPISLPSPFPTESSW